MSKRTPYWIDERDYAELSNILREDEALSASESGRGITAELGVARTRFENGRFHLSLARVLGKPGNSFPLRLSDTEHDTLLTWSLSDELREKFAA